MVQITNSKKKLNNKKIMKDNDGIKNLKRKLITEEVEDLNSKDGNIEIIEKPITNKLSRKKIKKAKLEITTESKKADSVSASDDEQGNGSNENENANLHNKVLRKDNARSGGCCNCEDPNHVAPTCENICKFCRNNEDGHKRKDCPRCSTRSMGCQNCKDPDHIPQTCEKKCKFCRENKDGHLRKDCPRAEFCRNCGGKHYGWNCEKECKLCNISDGHARKDCLKDNPKFGGCRNCLDPDHIALTCENKCQFCRNNEDGHIRKDCKRANLTRCYNCNQKGHARSYCPNEPRVRMKSSKDSRKMKTSDSPTSTNQLMSNGRNTKEKPSKKSKKKLCHRCGEKGHLSKACTQKKKCNFCKSEDHLQKDCPDRKNNEI